MGGGVYAHKFVVQPKLNWDSIKSLRVHGAIIANYIVLLYNTFL